MTDETPQSDADTRFAAWLKQSQDQTRRIAEARPANKQAVFDALARAGVTRVDVQFDGCGDSGQIESLDAFAGDAPIELPSGEAVQFAQPTCGQDTVAISTLSLREAIETLAYDYLEETHESWEDNDGAFGDFTFDVANRTISLAYNERHMESDYSEHVF